MKRVVVVFGVVHPQGGGWFLDQPWLTTGEDGSKIVILLTASHYSMQITTDGPDDSEAAMADGSFLSWVNEVIYGHQPVLRSILDSMGFHLGTALEPEMTAGVVDGIGVMGSLTTMPAYGTTESPSISGEAMAPALSLAHTNPFVRSALADVRHALRFDADSPFFCYRALDSLRQHFAATEGPMNESKSWEKTRTELGIDHGEIMALKNLADSRRHGGAGTSLHADHLRWTLWTREVVQRFINKYAPSV